MDDGDYNCVCPDGYMDSGTDCVGKNIATNKTYQGLSTNSIFII